MHKVYHKGLLFKLEQMGICGNLLKWLESYLSGRSLKVVINGVESNPRYINASVPQGSILGPLLFLVYVNDLVSDLETTPYLFADDTSLLEIINPRNVNGSFDKINRDLESLSYWAAQWRVNFNATKTVYMIMSNKKNPTVYPDLTLNGQVITRVTSHKHLGITLTKDMSWNLHIDAIIKKAASRLSGIRRIRFLITRKARVTLYNALVLPVLEYGGVIFDNCTLYLKQRMESIQRRAAIICTCAFRNTSYDRLLGELGWNTLDQRRKHARLSLFYKMNHKNCEGDDPCTDCRNGVGVPDYLKQLVPKKVEERTDYNLRNSKDLTTVKTKKVKVYNSFIPKTVREWNNLDLFRYAPSLSSFKASYKKGMLRSPNPLHFLEFGDANIYHTRLRLGLSHLKSHLFTHNLIDSPTCGCGLEPETLDHYVLRCPVFGLARIEMYHTMVDILDDHLLISLKKDSDIVNLFLHGHAELSYDKNILIYKMAMTFINKSERFSSDSLQ